MSKLRQQLQQLRDAYGSIRYDGDLAGDFLGSHRTASARTWRNWFGGASALAAAAAIVLLVIVQARTANQRNGGGIDMAVGEARQPVIGGSDEGVVIVASAGQGPTLWNSFESVPSLFDSLSAASDQPAVPSFPSLSDVEVSVQQQQGTAEDSQ